MRDPFSAIREPPPPDIGRPSPKKPVRSDSTARMPSRGNENTRPETSTGKPTGLRPAGSTSSRGKDIAPASSLSRLRIAEDDSHLEGPYASKPAASTVSNASSAAAPGSSYGRRDGLSQSPPINDAWNTSYGSPRTPHGRIRPSPIIEPMGSGRRFNDENMPTSASTLVNSPAEDDTTILSSRRYG